MFKVLINIALYVFVIRILKLLSIIIVYKYDSLKQNILKIYIY